MSRWKITRCTVKSGVRGRQGTRGTAGRSRRSVLRVATPPGCRVAGPGGLLRVVNPREDHVGQARLVADAGGVPGSFAVFLRGVAPRGLAVAAALADRALGFAEEDGDVLAGMEPVADEEGDNHDVPGAGEG